MRISGLSFAELAQRVVRVKECYSTVMAVKVIMVECYGPDKAVKVIIAEHVI